MADTTVQSAVTGGVDLRRALGGPYWVSTAVGAIVYADTSEDVNATKTSDGGSTWSTPVEVEAGSILAFNSWFEQATPGLTGDLIHCSWIDEADNELKYANYDISADSWSSVTTIATGLSPSGTSRNNRSYITLSNDGNIYVAYVISGSSSAFYRSTDGGSNFSSRASPWESNALDQVQLFPAIGTGGTGDDSDVSAVFEDVSATSNQLTVKMYDDSANSWTESALADGISEELLAEPSGAGAVRHADGAVLFVAHSQPDNTADDLRVFEIVPDSISAPTVTEKTAIYTNQGESHQAAVVIDQNSDDIYVGYLKGGTWLTAVDVVFHKSTDGATSWGTEQGYSEATADDLRVLHGGTSIGTSGGRLQWSFNNDDLTDIFVNLVNDIELTASGGGSLLPHLLRRIV